MNVHRIHDDFSFTVPNTPVPIAASSMFKPRQTLSDLSLISDGKESIGIIDLNELDDLAGLLDPIDDDVGDTTIEPANVESRDKFQILDSRYIRSLPAEVESITTITEPHRTFSDTSIKFDVSPERRNFNINSYGLPPYGQSDDEIDTEDELDAIRATGRVYGDVARGTSEGSAEDNVRPGLEGGSSEETDYPLYRRSVEGEQELPVPGDGGGGGDGSSDPESEDLVSFSKFTPYTDVTYPQPMRHRGNGHFHETEPRLRPLGNEETRQAGRRVYSALNNNNTMILDQFGESINFNETNELGQRESDVLGFFEHADGAAAQENVAYYNRVDIGDGHRYKQYAHNGVESQMPANFSPDDFRSDGYGINAQEAEQAQSADYDSCLEDFPLENLPDFQYRIPGEDTNEVALSPEVQQSNLIDFGSLADRNNRRTNNARFDGIAGGEADGDWLEMDGGRLGCDNSGAYVPMDGHTDPQQRRVTNETDHNDSGFEVYSNANNDDSQDDEYERDYDQCRFNGNGADDPATTHGYEDDEIGELKGQRFSEEGLINDVFLSPGNSGGFQAQLPAAGSGGTSYNFGSQLAFRDLTNNAMEQQQEFSESFLDVSDEEFRLPDDVQHEFSVVEKQLKDEKHLLMTTMDDENAVTPPSDWTFYEPNHRVHDPSPSDREGSTHNVTSDYNTDHAVDILSISTYMKRRSEAIGSLDNDPDVPRPEYFGLDVMSPPRERTPIILMSPDALKEFQNNQTPQPLEATPGSEATLNLSDIMDEDPLGYATKQTLSSQESQPTTVIYNESYGRKQLLANHPQSPQAMELRDQPAIDNQLPVMVKQAIGQQSPHEKAGHNAQVLTDHAIASQSQRPQQTNNQQRSTNNSLQNTNRHPSNNAQNHGSNPQVQAGVTQLSKQSPSSNSRVRNNNQPSPNSRQEIQYQQSTTNRQQSVQQIHNQQQNAKQQITSISQSHKRPNNRQSQQRSQSSSNDAQRGVHQQVLQTDPLANSVSKSNNPLQAMDNQSLYNTQRISKQLANSLQPQQRFNKQIQPNIATPPPSRHHPTRSDPTSSHFSLPSLRQSTNTRVENSNVTEPRTMSGYGQNTEKPVNVTPIQLDNVYITSNANTNLPVMNALCGATSPESRLNLQSPKSNTSRTSTDLNYSHANEMCRTGSFKLNRPATPGGSDNDSAMSDSSIDITLNTIGRLVADTSASANASELVNKLMALTENKAKTQSKRKVLKPTMENFSDQNSGVPGIIDCGDKKNNLSVKATGVEKSGTLETNLATANRVDFNKENHTRSNVYGRSTNRVDGNQYETTTECLSTGGSRLSEQLASVSPIYERSMKPEKSGESDQKYPMVPQQIFAQNIAEDKLAETKSALYGQKPTNFNSKDNLNNLSVTVGLKKVQQTFMSHNQQPNTPMINISTLDDSNAFKPLNRESMALFTPNVHGAEHTAEKHAAAFPYSTFMCDSFKVMDVNTSASYYCSTPARPDGNIFLPCPIHLHLQPPPQVCCIGVSTDIVLTVENKAPEWVECYLSAADVSINGSPLDSHDRTPFIVKPKVTVAPNESQIVTVLFVPKHPGSYCGMITGDCRLLNTSHHPYQLTANPARLHTATVNPNIKITPDPQIGLHYGQLGWGGWKALNVCMVNMEPFPVPVRLGITQNNLTWESFCFGTPSDNEISVISQTSRPTALHLNRNIANVTLPSSVAHSETRVTVYCKLPERQRSRQGALVNREELGAVLNIELDTPTCVYHIQSMPMCVVAGSQKLKIPSKNQVVSLSSSPGNMNYCKVTLKNEGNIDMVLSLKIAEGENEDLFSVYPTQVTIKPQGGADVSIVFKPKVCDVPVYKSLCLMQIDPSGPVYEIPIIGKLTAATKQQNAPHKDTFLCNKKELRFGTVPLGDTERMKVVLRNISESPVLVQLTFAHDGDQFKFVKFPEAGDCIEVTAQDVLMEPHSDLPVTIAFIPTKICSMSSKVCVNTGGSSGGKYYVGLYAHGGASKLSITDANKNGNMFWIHIEDLTEISCDIRCRKKVVVENIGHRAAYVKAICTPGTMRKVTVEPNQFVLSPTEVTTVTMTLQNLSSRADTDYMGRVALYYSDEINLIDFNNKNGKKLTESDHKLDKTYTDIFEDLMCQAENILSLPVVTLELRPPPSRVRPATGDNVPQMEAVRDRRVVSSVDQVRSRHPVHDVNPYRAGVESREKVSHRPSIDADDIRIKDHIVVFPPIGPHNMTRYKVEVQNCGHVPHSIEIIQPCEPFFVRQANVTVKDKRYVRLPIEFCPIKKGNYAGEVILNVDNGCTLVLKLTAACQ